MQHLQPNTTLQGGKYRIERVLGQGGFGNTYVGYNTEFEETVAIKEFFMKGVTERDETTSFVSVSNADNVQLFEEQREKFKKEARRLRKLKNEHIVKVHDLFEENGTAYYVMDYVDGENLAELLKRRGHPMTESEVNSILPQILDALKAVHDAGFCHLDIKPSNIMLEKGGKVKLIDFGASKQLGASGTLTTNAPTAFAQTPGFAPREQIEQSLNKIGPWTDIYALGATLYNLLTSKKPPLLTDIDDDMSEDKHVALPFPESIGGLRFLVLQMMKTNRLQRPQNIDAIIAAKNRRKEETKQESKQQPITQGTIAYDDEATIISESKTKEQSTELSQVDTGETKETILLNLKSNDDKVQPKDQDNLPKEDIVQEEEATTILVVSKGDGKSITNQPPINELPQRAIKVGDFIFEDGNYSNEHDGKGKNVIGVLFSYYGGAHGQILSPINPSNGLSINGKKLEWHEASIGEWVEIIQNLGHCKVNFVSWDYKYYSDEVKDILKKYQISETRYMTRKSVSGASYIVSLEQCTMTPLEDSATNLPYIYISNF